MSRRLPLLALCGLVALLALSAEAGAQATPTFTAGAPVSYTVGSLPSGYGTYWTSDRDGYLAYGNTLSTRSLSVGRHQISALIYYLPSQRLVWRGGVAIEVVAPAPQVTAPAPAPAPTAQTGLVAPGEFEAVSQVILGCSDAYMVSDVYPAMIRGIAGQAEVVIYVASDYVRYDLIDILDQAGIARSAYRFVRVPLDSIWMRDYGPLFAKRSGALEVVDLDYYPGRPVDDDFPRRFAAERGLANKRLPLYWEGGNYTSDGQGRVFASSQLLQANRVAPAQVSSLVRGAFGGELVVLEKMLDDGGTGHLDMFALWTGPRSVLLNRFPAGHQNRDRMERNAQALAAIGVDVRRIDLADTRFSSYSNGVIVNGVALVPTYGRSATDNAALAAYRAAGYQAVGVDCRRLIQWSGAIHCISMTVPR